MDIFYLLSDTAGNGTPIINTALAMLSLKSIPSLERPLHTAIKTAPLPKESYINEFIISL